MHGLSTLLQLEKDRQTTQDVKPAAHACNEKILAATDLLDDG
jgi:hypothetical protein